jgi:peptidoglycan hydrolase-like protein with peptidoglycan-binding domain
MEEQMFTNMRVRSTLVFTFLMAGILALSFTSLASAANSKGDIKKAQQTLRDKGYDPGQIDGHLGSHTRQAIGQYQKAENLPVTQRLDAETAGKLGVEPESVGSSFKTAGKDVGEGGEQFGGEIKDGKPVAAGKDLGKSIGSGGKKVGEGVKKAVTP